MSIPKGLRRRIHRRDKLICQYCGVACILPAHTAQNNPRLATLDHIIPQCAGGLDAYANLITACKTCNERKGALLVMPVSRGWTGQFVTGEVVRALARQIVREETLSSQLNRPNN